MAEHDILEGFTPLQDVSLAPAQTPQEDFPTLESIIADDRYSDLNTLEQANTLLNFRNEYAAFIVQNNLVENDEQYRQELEFADEQVRKHLSPNSLSAGLRSAFGFNPGNEIVAEGAGFLSTGLDAIARSARSAFTVEGQTAESVERDIARAKERFPDFEAIRKGAEEVIAEDTGRRGRDFLSQGEFNLTTIGAAANRLTADVAGGVGATMVAGPVGGFSYFAATGAARTNRTQRQLMDSGQISNRSSAEMFTRDLATGAASGALNYLSFGFLSNSVRAGLTQQALGNAAIQSGMRVAGAAGTEGATEFMQSIIETIGTEAGSYDEFISIMSNPETFKNAAVEASVGAVLGGGVGGVGSLSPANIQALVQSKTYREALQELKVGGKSVVDSAAEIGRDMAAAGTNIEPLSDLSKTINEMGPQAQEADVTTQAVEQRQIAEDQQVATEEDVEFETTFGELDTEVRGQREAQRQQQELDAARPDPDTTTADFSVADLRSEVLDQGGIDITAEQQFKDVIRTPEGNLTISPSFVAESGRGLRLDQLMKTLVDDGKINPDTTPEQFIQMLQGQAVDTQPRRQQLEALQEAPPLPSEVAPETDFMASQPGLPQRTVGAPVSTAPIPAPGLIGVQEGRAPTPAESGGQTAPGELTPAPVAPPLDRMPVPLNFDQSPEVRKDTTRKLRSIAQIVEDDLDLPVRRGKDRALFQNALGVHKRTPQVIRTRMGNDLRVIAHEVGHGLSNKMGLNQDQNMTLAIENELVAIGGEQSQRPNQSDASKLEEGRAEYMHERLLDPARAQELAPAYHAQFEAALAENPRLQEGLAKLEAAYADIKAQSPAERVKAGIVSQEDIAPQGIIAALRSPEAKLATKTRLLDDLAPLEDLVEKVYSGKDLSILDNPYTLARLGRGSNDISNFFVKNGIHDFTGEKMSDGLAPILKGMTAVEFGDFDGYLKARRQVLDLQERGLVTQSEAAEAQLGIPEFEAKNPEFKQKAAELKVFTDTLLEYSVREGILAREDADRMLAKSQAYIPLARAYDQIGGVGQTRAGNPFRELKGDTMDTLSGLATLESNVRLTVQAAANMRVYRALEKMTEIKGVGRYIEKVDVPFNSQTGRQDPALFAKDEPIFTFVDPQTKKYVALRVKDELLLESLQSHPAVMSSAAGALSWGNIPKRIARGAAGFVRRTAITNPAFVLKNVARDTFAAGIQSKNNFIPLVDSVVGAYEIFTNSDMYKKFEIGGAGQGTFTRTLEDGASKLNQGRRAVDYLTNPWRIVEDTIVKPLERIAQFGEEATRVGDFRKTYNRMKSMDNVTEEQAIAQAAFEARDLTIDFQKSGISVREMNLYVPFLNASIQGMQKNWAAIKTKKGLIGTSLLAILPELLLWSFLKDDEKYQEQPDYVKDNYWLVPTFGTIEEPFYQYPKPQGYNYFANVTRDTLDTLDGRDKFEMDNIAANIVASIGSEAQSVIPALIKPMIELWANKSFFREQPILDRYLAQLPLEDQHNQYTSEVAKKLAPVMGMSPVYFDHVVYGYATNWGKAATASADYIFMKRIEDVPVPEKTLARSTMAELTGLKSFLGSNPNYMAVSIQEIFEQNNRISGLERSFKGKTRAEVTRRKEESSALWKNRHKIKAARARIGRIGKRIQAIYKHKTMSPEEKQNNLSREFDRMLETARRGLGRD